MTFKTARQKHEPLTVYLQNFGRTEVISAFSCYLASANGWTFPKPPAIFATLPGAGCYFVQIQI